jgi:hypothetical protein
MTCTESYCYIIDLAWISFVGIIYGAGVLIAVYRANKRDARGNHHEK